MNIEGHDLDKYFKNENEKKEIKKKEIDSSLRTINSEGENRNSQQIVDNLEEEEEKNNNIVNNNIQQKKSGESNMKNEKLKTVNDIITGTVNPIKNCCCKKIVLPEKLSFVDLSPILPRLKKESNNVSRNNKLRTVENFER